VDVVGAVAAEDLGGVSVEARGRVWPDVGRCLHQALVGLVIEPLEPAAQHLHAVAAIEPGQSREGELTGRGEVMDGRSARREVELLRVEVDVAEVLERVVTARREPGRVLPRVAEVPDAESSW
jgi:hypothetical protein